MNLPRQIRRSIAILAIALMAPAFVVTASWQARAASDIVTTTIAAPFDKVATKLKRQIARHKLVIVKEVPFQQMVAMVGVKTGKAKGYEIFHPRYGKTLFKNDTNALIDVPLRIVLLQSGSKVKLYYRKPSVIFAPYSGLGGLGTELDKLFASITAQVAK
jgi:uncharacterized protein (DUF302 family)